MNSINPNTPPLLSCRKIEKSFGKVSVLNNINFDLYSGEFLALLGPSGCGKSTLLRIISGFESIDQGCVTIGGKEQTIPGAMVAPEDRKIGMVFQDYALFPHLSVERNIAFGLKGSKKEKRERVMEMLELINLQKAARKMPHELSGGEQQRVAVARAIAPTPTLILLDEPFSNLDSALRVQLREEIHKILRKTGVSCILVTHDQMEAFSFSDRLLIMNHGVIEDSGSAEAVYQNPKTPWVASFTGTANFLVGSASEKEAMILSELGNFPKPSTPNGSHYQLMVRPENILLEQSEDKKANGVIESVLFMGSGKQLSIRLFNGERVIAHTASSSSWKEGASVLIKAKEVVTYCGN